MAKEQTSGWAALRVVAILALFFCSSFLTSAPARAQEAEQAQETSNRSAPDETLSKEQLSQLVAPIALYPDSLLSQILMASTYPLEVVHANRWVKTNRKVKGKALEDAMQSQPWDPSIKSLTAFPDVLQMMNDKLDWTQKLGDAFLAQQADVLAAVQTLRERADEAGTLKTTKQQKVKKSQSYIRIEPEDPAVVYVPAYNSETIYGSWPYPDYPPYEWYPPGYDGGSGIWWGPGILGGLILWGIANWPDWDIDIDLDRYNRFNKTNLTDRKWQHNVAHRRGVPYANHRLNDQFRKEGQRKFAANREQFRGRADAGRKALTAAGGAAVAKKAIAKRPAQLPAKAGKAKAKQGAKARRPAGPKNTAFNRSMGAKQVRAQSARGKASRAASRNRSFASRGGGRRGGGGRGGRGGGRRSDIRVKHDVVLIARLSNGMGLYRFAYNGSNKLYVGVIAQEALKVAPQTVSRDREGYLRVHYDDLGVPFQSYDQWRASGARIPKLRSQ